MTRFYEDVCLYEQPFVKDQTISLGENIAVRRFVRFKLGEDVSRTIENRGDHPEDGAAATGVAVKKPKGPTLGSGAAAVKPDE